MREAIYSGLTIIRESSLEFVRNLKVGLREPMAKNIWSMVVRNAHRDCSHGNIGGNPCAILCFYF